jgi:hypothetical protein
MILSPRNFTYQKPSLALDRALAENQNNYQGQNDQYHYPRPIPHFNSQIPLTVRSKLRFSPPLGPLSAEERPCQATLWEIQSVVTSDLNQVHFANIRKSLEKRLQVAEARGDKGLLSILIREFEELTAI